MKIELKNKVEELEKELVNEVSLNGQFSKRAIFLMATINIYCKKLGNDARYTW